MADKARGLGHRHFVLGMLVLIYAFNTIDRQIIAILQEPIRAEFGLEDWQLGLLSGVAFGLFYTTLGLPIARYTDRGGNRVTVVAAALALWSLMTAACGLARSFVQLLVFRMGVGIGEAGCIPPSQSLIADYFAPGERGRAMGFYTSGVAVGALTGLIGGSWLAEHFGWRVALLTVGLPGVLVAIVFKLFAREPARGLSEGGARPEELAVPTQEAIRILLRNRTYRQIMFGGAVCAMATYGMGFWIPSFLIRNHHLEIQQVGLWWGLIFGISGLIGSMLSGYLVDRLGRRDPRGILLIPMVGLLVAIPFQFVAINADDAVVALLFFLVPTIVYNVWIAPMFMLSQSLVPVGIRATSSAVLSFVVNSVGLAAGPLIVGAISDICNRVANDAATGLRWALLAIVLTNVWSAAHYLLGMRSIRADIVSR